MTPAPLGSDRWRRIEELVRDSLDVPDGQRAAFLREICGTDEPLRLEVESLLLAEDFEESPLIAGIVDDATAHLLKDED